MLNYLYMWEKNFVSLGCWWASKRCVSMAEKVNKNEKKVRKYLEYIRYFSYICSVSLSSD